jgi:two-component system LytT family response regulator
MEQLQILIVDDDGAARSALRGLLDMCGYAPDSISEADGVQSGLESIRLRPPQVLITDVEMEDGTGFDLLAQLKSYDFPVIFMTAHNKYAVQAFRFCAIDFLEKPIDPEELGEALNKVRNEIHQRDLSTQFRMFHEFMHVQSTADKKLVLKDAKAMYFVRLGDILHCEAGGPYTDFHLADGSKLTISRPLKEYEQILETCGFVRTHHSHLVNIAHVTRLDRADGGSLVLDNGHSIPISQRKWERVLDMLSAR